MPLALLRLGHGFWSSVGLQWLHDVVLSHSVLFLKKSWQEWTASSLGAGGPSRSSALALEAAPGSGPGFVTWWPWDFEQVAFSL